MNGFSSCPDSVSNVFIFFSIMGVLCFSVKVYPSYINYLGFFDCVRSLCFFVCEVLNSFLLTFLLDGKSSSSSFHNLSYQTKEETFNQRFFRRKFYVQKI